MSNESHARIVIDRLLREAGWDIENPGIVSTEEPAADGRTDYPMEWISCPGEFAPSRERAPLLLR